MRRAFSIGIMLFGVVAARGAASISSWVPIFQGIEQATGTNSASAGGTLSVHALRIDLQDPDIRLKATPPAPNYVANVRETLFQTPAEFLAEHRVQVAVNAVHFSPAGYGHPSGTPGVLTGLVISEGQLVSAQSGTAESESAMLFTTNNQPAFVYFNSPPTNTEGIYTAVAGMYPVLSNGVNISYGYTNSPDRDLHGQQPRTAFGLSQDGRYLFLVTIDGRQDSSDGALDWETADFLILFGAWNGMNLDGGGSTCMVKASYCGDPIAINNNSYQVAIGRPGSQRPVGCNFGVYAKPLPGPIQDLVVEPGPTTALITWETEVPATTQVEYGLTQNYGNSTPLDSRLTRFHVANLDGLLTGSNYYFKAHSTAGFDEFSVACRLIPVPAATIRTQVFDVTNSWKYTTNNLDGMGWKTPGYDDSEWLGPGPGLLHVENNALVSPKNTALPPGYISQTSPIPRTYYFRTHFQFSGSISGLSLVFSNYVDDGAVFYLNGAEIQRLRMPAFPTAINNLTPATGTPPCGGGGEATCPDVFTVSGNLLANLVQGDNVLAVELHNAGAISLADVVFGSALILSRPGNSAPKLNISLEDNQATLYWNAQGFTLQELDAFSQSASNVWSNLSGNSPVIVPTANNRFFRLRQ